MTKAEALENVHDAWRKYEDAVAELANLHLSEREACDVYFDKIDRLRDAWLRALNIYKGFPLGLDASREMESGTQFD